MTLQVIFLHPLLWWLLSVAVVVWAVFKVQEQHKLQWSDRLAILLLLTLGSIMGGDLFVSLSSLVFSEMNKLFSVPEVLTGAKGTIGAILGSAVVVFIYLRLRKIPVLVYADNIIPYAALAYAIARVGCFTNGDDFGIVSNLPWAVSFGPFTEAYHAHLSRGWISPGEAESLRVHPAQLYHALAGLAGFFLLKSWRSNWHGSRFALAWIYYGITRFVIQFFRDDHWANAAVIDPAQWFSLLFIVIGLLIWFQQKHYFKREKLVVTG